MTVQQQLTCPNCKSAVKSFQFFGDSCAFCNNALQRGLKGIRSSSILNQGSTRAETSKTEAPANVFTLRLSEPVYENEAPFSSFFVKRILKAMRDKHPEFDYATYKDANGRVVSFEFEGADEKTRKELESTLAWTIKRIRKRRYGKQS
jgi:hypothetical protein